MDAALKVAIAALFGQVLLVIAVYARLLMLRVRAVQRRDVRLKDVALETGAYGEAIRKIENNLSNQFELPVMFYVCVVLAAATDRANAGLAVFSVLFAASRWVHAWIHTGSNFVPWRFYAFVAGAIAAAGCWLSLGLALLA